MADRHRFVDCQGLAGAWTLGTIQTGRFDLVRRVSQPGGFGDAVVNANAGLLGPRNSWPVDEGVADEWVPDVGVAYVCGTPPCSGFSVYNTSKKDNFRGADSPINSCMRDLVGYAARCYGEDGGRGAEVVAFESVQGAYKQGRRLMRALVRELSAKTRQTYDLTHVLMSGSSVGSAQYRHRYYFVAHRIPFGIERPEPAHVVTVRDAIGDLEGQRLQDERQAYVGIPSGWAAGKRSASGFVTEHVCREDDHRVQRLIRHLIGRAGWQEGEYAQDAARRLGRDDVIDELFPGRWNEAEGSLKGLPRHWPKRLRYDAPAWVVTGNSSLSFVHPTRPRVLTVRELSRLMGYPDDWRWPDGLSVDHRSSLIGKCCPVQSGEWISGWVGRALDGEPGPAAEKIDAVDGAGEERVFDCTLDYRRWDPAVSGFKLQRRPDPAAARPAPTV